MPKKSPTLKKTPVDTALKQIRDKTVSRSAATDARAKATLKKAINKTSMESNIQGSVNSDIKKSKSAFANSRDLAEGSDAKKALKNIKRPVASKQALDYKIERAAKRAKKRIK